MPKIKEMVLDLVRRIGGDELLLHVGHYGDYTYMQQLGDLQVWVSASPDASAPWVDLYSTEKHRSVLMLRCDSIEYAAKIVNDYITWGADDAA